MTDKILLNHGSGGKLTHDLIQKTILRYFKNPVLAPLNDSAVFNIPKGSKLAFTTDSYVVNPIFFKGGDIGKLAVCGTVNDLAMVAAEPLYLSASCIIEAGFPMKDLEKILKSMQAAAKEAKVSIITGDTKVVETGSADKIFINTSGIGIIRTKHNISGSNAKPKDKIIMSGTIGDHGIAILSARESLKTNISSDCAPLNQMVAEMQRISKNIHVLRDPTRGGLATTLNEIAKQSKVNILIDETKIQINETVSSTCELLGFDPLYLANEGKLVCFVSPEDAEKILKIMKKNKYGKKAAIIGEVTSSRETGVYLKTSVGGIRILDMLTGEQLPRIC